MSTLITDSGVAINSGDLYVAMRALEDAGVRHAQLRAHYAEAVLVALAAQRAAMNDTKTYDCTCVVSCADDPATMCSLSGENHVHPDDGTGTFGPCPVHPDAPGDL